MLRVLIVDDDDDIRMMLRTVMTADARFEIAGEAEDGVAAVDLCRRLVPDAVLLDVQMPHMDGIQALRTIVEQMPEVHVVIFSSDPARRDDAVSLGAAWHGKTDPLADVLATLAAPPTRR